MNIHKHARLTPAGRALLVQRVLHEGWSRARAAAALGVSRITVAKWVARYSAEGHAGLVDRSSRPHRIPRLTSATKAELAVSLRHTGLTGREIAQRLSLARSTVFRIFARLGVSRLRGIEPDRPENRYEWPRPGDLLHLDVKKLGKFRQVGHRITGHHAGHPRTRGAGWDFVHVCVDDHSRVSYVEVLEDERGETATAFLKRAVDWFRAHGVTPRRVLTDNGSCYRSAEFRRACKRLRLRHILTRPYTPRTNGKAERFIQTMMREWAYVRPYETSRARRRALPTWLLRYNEQRPHGSLGYNPPISRIRG